MTDQDLASRPPLVVNQVSVANVTMPEAVEEVSSFDNRHLPLPHKWPLLMCKPLMVSFRKLTHLA